MFRTMTCLLAIVAVSVVTPAISAGEITGFYMETRTCQVYTGPCFANAEVGLSGKNAIMAWSVKNGACGRRQGECNAGVCRFEYPIGNQIGDPCRRSRHRCSARSAGRLRQGAGRSGRRRRGGDRFSSYIDEVGTIGCQGRVDCRDCRNDDNPCGTTGRLHLLQRISILSPVGQGREFRTRGNAGRTIQWKRPGYYLVDTRRSKRLHGDVQVLRNSNRLGGAALLAAKGRRDKS